MKVTKYEIDMLGVGAADAFLIHFFDENFDTYEIKIERNGLMKNWPSGFFDLEKKQLMEILRLSQSIK